MSIALNIIVAVLAFTLMIFIHELGHFSAAKFFKIRVLEFALGMGPAIFKKRKGETLYSIRCVPFGGFCKMDGEDESSDDPHAFRNAARWKRAIVLFAGAFLNIVLGFVIFLIIYAQSPILQPVITSMMPDTYIAQSGIMAGDRIVKLDDTRINIHDDFRFFMDRIDGTKAINVTIDRGGQLLTFAVMPSKQEIKYAYGENDIQIENILNGIPGESQNVAYKDEKSAKELAGTTKTTTQYLLGFTPDVSAPTISSVAREAFYETIFTVKLVYVSLFELITGKVPANKVMGAIGIVDVMGQATRAGWVALFGLIALITINLGIMNLLPIPALDGGRLVFLGIESIIRRPIPPEREGMVHMIGFVILILLMLLVMFNDIVRIVTGA